MQTSNMCSILIRNALAIAALMLAGISATANAQVFEWARMGGGPGWKHGNAIGVDDTGNSYIVGEYSGSDAISFGNTTYSAPSGTSGFIVKYGSDGTLQWVRPIEGIEGSGTVIPRSIAVVGSNLYVTGECDGAINFDSNSQSSIPNGSSFLAKYTLSASSPPKENWVAIFQPETSGRVRALGVAVGYNHVYVCGSIVDSVDFRPGKTDYATISVKPLNDTSLFVAEYDADGKPLRVMNSTPVSTSSVAVATSIAALPSGGAILTGRFTGTVDYCGSRMSSPSGTNTFIAKCPAMGTSCAAFSTIQLSSSSYAVGRSIAIDADGNSGYVGGTYAGTLQIGGTTLTTSSTQDFFLAKFSLSPFTVTWIKSSQSGIAGMAAVNGIALKHNGLFVTGSFSGTTTLGVGGSGKPITLGSLGNHDILVARYTADGDLVWAQRAGNTYNGLQHSNRNHFDQGTGIAVDNDTNAYIVGEFGGTAHFFNAPDIGFDHYRNVFVGKAAARALQVSGAVTYSNVGVAGRTINIMESNTGLLHQVITDTNGAYTTYAPITRPGISTLTLGPVMNIPHWIWTPELVKSDSMLLLASSTGINFEILSPYDTQIGPSNLRITMMVQSPEFAAPDSSVRYLIRYENVGHRSSEAVTITLVYDQRLQAPICLPPAASSIGSTLTWDVPQIEALKGGAVIVTFSSLKIPKGTPYLIPPVQSCVNISPGANELTADLGDNTCPIKQDVVQPNDPNGKYSFPVKNVSVADVRQGASMTYEIWFNNTGSGTANGVTVIDTLDPVFEVLDTESIKLLSWKPKRPRIVVEKSNVNVVRFEFSDVQLPRVNWHQGDPNQGFVRFSIPLIRHEEFTPIGQNFVNTAWIRFHGTETTIPTSPSPQNCIAPDFTFSPTCLGEATQFTSLLNDKLDYLTDDTVGLSCVWDFGDGDSSTLRNPTHKFTHPGLFPVTLTFTTEGNSSGICGLAYRSSAFMIWKAVTVSTRQIPLITQPSKTLLMSTPAAAYQWFRDTIMIDSATGPYFHPTDSGHYRVRVHNFGGCESWSEPYYYNIYGSAPTAYADSTIAIIRPNPGHGLFMLDVGRSPAHPWTVAVIGLRGNVVLRRTIAAGRSNCELDLDGKPSGTYTARIEIDGVTTMRRFVLMR